MRLKTGLNLSKNYSYNFSIPKRQRKNIKFVILHYTGMKNELSALKKLCDKKSKVSAHYFIKENGKVINLVPDLYEAWHAGNSRWKNLNSINKYSIGIEISNPGHENRYKNFSLKQIFSIEKLLKFLMRKYNIKYHNILGHSDIAPSRKKDPGEKFPWSLLAKKKLCLGHNLIKKQIRIYRNIKLSSFERKIFLMNLKKIGYSKIRGISTQKSNEYIIEAFQRRFRQDLVNGRIDKECYLISEDLK